MDFTIQTQWEKYLKRVDLKESEMLPIQTQETKRAFFAGVSQLLVLLREDVSALEENEAINTMERMETECGEFWKTEVEKDGKQSRV